MKKAVVLILIAAIILLPVSALAKNGNNGKAYGKDKGNPTEIVDPGGRGNGNNGNANNSSGNSGNSSNNNTNGIGLGKGLTPEQQMERQQRRETFRENKMTFQELKLQRKERIREQQDLMQQWKAEICEQFGDLDNIPVEERAAYWKEFEALKQAMREAHRFCLEIRAADEEQEPVLPEEPDEVVPADPPTEEEVDVLVNIL